MTTQEMIDELAKDFRSLTYCLHESFCGGDAMIKPIDEIDWFAFMEEVWLKGFRIDINEPNSYRPNEVDVQIYKAIGDNNEECILGRGQSSNPRIALLTAAYKVSGFKPPL